MQTDKIGEITLNADSVALLNGLPLVAPLHDATDLREALSAFRPMPVMRLLHWSCEHVINDQGRPYDHSAFPHLGAPGGPMDAADDETVRTIALQFATRLGKSFFGQCLLLSRLDLDPCPMLIATESERGLKQRLMKRLYKMVYARPNLAAKLLKRSKKDHKQDLMELMECTISGAWARSPGTLADLNIKVGMANELDKAGWDGHSTSTEGSPIKLFNERFKDYQSTRKIVYESTPSIAGRSRIERLRIQSTNCQYYVPCPHCGTYQQLRIGEQGGDNYDRTVPGSLRWTGRDKAHAKATAYYHCLSDECPPILDEHRTMMMRRGVWAPLHAAVDSRQARHAAERWLSRLTAEMEGETFLEPLWISWKHADWLASEAPPHNEDAGYQLSSLYALSLGWGDVAAEYVASENKPRDWHNFENSWLAQTYELAERKQTWEQLGNRMVRDTPAGIVPEDYSILTMGIDKQEDGRHPYVIEAWDQEKRSHVIDYGEAMDLEEIERLLMARWPHADGGKPLRVAMALFDSGFRPKGVGEFCRKMQAKKVPVHPCKGANAPLDAIYRIRKQGKDSAMPGLRLIVIDGLATQDHLDQQLHTLTYPDKGAATLFQAPLAEHQDFLEQLLNDSAVSVTDATGRDVIRWERINRDVPNDYRDCKRYSHAAMTLALRGRAPRKRVLVTVDPNKQSKPKPAPGRPMIERPGGWI